jgi:hypothetical protein
VADSPSVFCKQVRGRLPPADLANALLTTAVET